jgi:hypothetical protein
VKTYRLYFNCRDDAPRVWSYDEGPGTLERTVEAVLFVGCCGHTEFDTTKRLPQPSAWISVTGILVERAGIATVYGEDVYAN